jgi:hypothetical protein
VSGKTNPEPLPLSIIELCIDVASFSIKLDTFQPSGGADTRNLTPETFFSKDSKLV